MSTSRVDDAEFPAERQRVLASESSRTAEALRRLLGYLADAYISGGGRSLEEYSIGRDVMNKPEDYDPRVDTSVRAQIGKPRQRLDRYSNTEDPAAPHRLSIPKGHFALAFEPVPSPFRPPLRRGRRRPWPAKFNRQIPDLPFEQDFVIEQSAVKNLRPRPGEAKLYQKPSASTSNEGTRAAAEYLSTPAALEGMMNHLRKETGSMPDNYQVIIRSRFKSQVPIQTEFVIHHVLRPRVHQ